MPGAGYTQTNTDTYVANIALRKSRWPKMAYTHNANTSQKPHTFAKIPPRMSGCSERTHTHRKLH